MECWDGLKLNKKCLSLLLTVFLVIGMSMPAGQVRAATPDKRVLFISSFNYSWDAVQDQIKGIQSVLTDGYFLDYEFMDSMKGDPEILQEAFYEGLKYRMQIIPKYDLVITGDDAALEFVLQYREELFSGIPVVYECVNEGELVQRAALDPLVIGVSKDTDVKKNIELGKMLLPGSRSVVILMDNTPLGKLASDKLEACKADFPEMVFDVINSSELTEKELIYRFKGLTKNDILIYGAMAENAEGKIYDDSEAIQLITTYSSAPVIRMMDSGLEKGLLGGYVVSVEESGTIAGTMAKEILKGRIISTMKREACPFRYIINESVLKSHHLNSSKLPKETILLYHEEGFWERHQDTLRLVIPLVVVLLAFAGFAVFDNLRIRKVMKELQEARQIMENASQHDFLTGLANRSKFVADLEELIKEKQPCTVLMLDIDDFKHINDTMGHGAGDDALRQIASRMKAMQTNILTPYRYAGDEFIMILKSAQPNLVEKTAYGCRQVFAPKVTLAGEKKTVTGSIGIASYPKDADDMEKLIVCADDAMYEVKKSGKNKFAYYKGPVKSATNNNIE